MKTTSHHPKSIRKLSLKVFPLLLAFTLQGCDCASRSSLTNVISARAGQNVGNIDSATPTSLSSLKFNQNKKLKHSFVSNIHLLRGGSDGPEPAEPAVTLATDVEDQQTIEIITSPTPVASNENLTKFNPKLQNAIERTGPALLMLFLLYIFIRYTGEKGLMYILIPLMQLGMYKETTGIIEDHNTKNNIESKKNFDLEIHIEKWWWFATVFFATSGRSLVQELRKTVTSKSILGANAVNLITFGMVAFGLVMSVVGMASHSNANADKIRSYLGEVAANHFALIFLIGQSSFWIKIVQSFGIGWLLYPALLVIVNDTMAYVFGVLFGKHKLLPRLSPKKTVEGFVGAAVSTIGISIPLLKFFISFISKRNNADGGLSICFDKFSSVLTLDASDGSATNLTKLAITMALYTSLISPFGGFLASAVKRAHGAKDFGSLIPGHGGVVDRMDCQIVTAPFIYLYLKWCLDGN